MATLCHICGRPLHPFGFQPLPCLHLRASHGYRSVVWSDCLASLHSSTETLMVQVDHVMIHPAHRTCTSITCAPFRSSTYVPSIRILFRVSSRCIDGISLRWLPWLWVGSKMQTVTPAVRKNCRPKMLGHSRARRLSNQHHSQPSVLWHKQPCSRHETGAQQLPRQARRSTRCVCTEILHTPAA